MTNLIVAFRNFANAPKRMLVTSERMQSACIAKISRLVLFMEVLLFIVMIIGKAFLQSVQKLRIFKIL
jgi:hypothetical protein